MEENQTVTAKTNPYKNANPCSRLFYCWLNAFQRLGYKKQIKKEDLYPVTPWDASERVSARLEEEWEREVLNKTRKDKVPELTTAVIRCFGQRFMIWAILILIEEAIKLTQPIILGKLIDYFSPDSAVTESEAYMYATAVALCAIVRAIIHQPHYFATQRLGMQIRIGCCSMVYKKALRLSNAAFQTTTTGQMSNLITNDVSRFDQALVFLHYLWVGPLQAVVIFLLLVYEIGWVCVFGYIFLILLVPFQSFLGKLFGKLRRKTAVLTDSRVRVMDEIVNAMRVIKMYAWEKPFSDMVFKVRTSEIAKVVSATIPLSINLTIGLVGNRALDLVMLAAYAATTDYMRASTMYVVILYCSTLRGTFLRFYPKAMQMKHECTVSLKRIQAFLQLPEHETNVDLYPGPEDDIWDSELTQEEVESVETNRTKGTSICIEDMNASWTKNEEEDSDVLKNINLKMKPGELLGVVGSVGSGKSSLLLSLLGELPMISGRVVCHGRTAYAAQQPWVFTGTVRRNILFGKEYNEEKFKKIVSVCALEKDLQILPKGDMTQVGERGVTLSGGQKARVSLARALYQDADIYLLDDPLSAVDSEVGKHIFEKCIQGYLKNTIIILVTHQLQFVGFCDRILVLKEGKEEALGTVDEIMKSGINVTSFLQSEDKGETDDEEESDGEDVQTNIPLPGHKKKGSIRRRSTIRKRPQITEAGESDTKEAKTDKGNKGGLVKEEQRSRGGVTFKTYKDYFSAGAGCLKFAWLLTVMIGAQVLYVCSDLWISVWADTEEWRYANRNETLDYEYESEKPCDSDDSGECGSGIMTLSTSTGPYGEFVNSLERYMFVLILLGIVVLTLMAAFYRGVYFFRVALKSAKTLHNAMFNAVLKAPIRFFDTNPVGRILNRFTKDVGTMDDQLPQIFFDFTQKALMILGIIIICCIINPIIIVPTLPIIALFGYLRHYSVQTTRDVKRLDGITRSPVYSHLAASVQGLWTIRAMKMETTFTKEFYKHQDHNTEAYFLFITTSRWFGIRLDLLASLFITLVVFLSVPAAELEWINAGLAGLMLSNAMSLSAAFQYTVRQSALVENMMTAVERIVEYTKLEPEAPHEDDENRPPEYWPRCGSITFEQMCLQYAPEEPLVLKDVTCQILPREKVGIVGRTGAGKSSLVTALFRLAEPDGGLRIDGVDIKLMGLHDLRNRLSIIPQDPVLFTDSVRRNLDPFDQYSDNVLWTALAEVQLHQAITDMGQGLDSPVGERGSNLSVGQRQLVCLARAVLRGNRILVLDEATANVDPRTDELIQETIRKNFRDCTVLTVAHRLHTVMDADRIMVLNEGRLVEFDSPYTLLQNSNSFLNIMVEKTGRNVSSKLRNIAKSHHEECARNQQTSISTTSNGFTWMPAMWQTAPMQNTYELLPSKSDDNFTFGVANTSNGYIPRHNTNGHVSRYLENGSNNNHIENGFIPHESCAHVHKPHDAGLSQNNDIVDTVHGNEDNTAIHGQQNNNVIFTSDMAKQTTEHKEQVYPSSLKDGELHLAKFNRGDRGFGFSLAGQDDKTGVPMWISRVEMNSPAHLEGDLKIGDEILEINGTPIEELTYTDVVKTIGQSDGKLRLLVKRLQYTASL